jgi:endonuclease YncB( thermonuclease family)
MRSQTLLASLLLLPPATASTSAGEVQSFEARVVAIHSGDTVTVLDRNLERHKVRLAGIDAPRKAQPFGERARRSLARSLYSKDVRVEWERRDGNGRLVARLWVTPPELNCRQPGCPKTLDVSLTQLASGLAWHCVPDETTQATGDRDRYASAEEHARARKAGLWSTPDPVPPWEWRPGSVDRPEQLSGSQSLPEDR